MVVAFPQDPLDATIEIYYDGAWQDITSYVYHREAAPIVITRGYTANSKNCDPGKLKLQINNRDSRFSPRNPTSPLYGKIGRNTPIRVSVTYSAVTYTRFVGEIVSWPPRWDVSGKDIWVPIEAAGILRRLGRGEKPVIPSLNLTILADSPVHYWRLDDAEGSTFGAPSLPNGTVSMTIDALSTIGWSQLAGPPGGEAFAPRLNEGFVEAALSGVTAPWTVEYSVLRPTDGSLDSQTVGSLSFLVDGAVTGVTTTVVHDTDVSERDWYHYKFTGTQNGANYEIRYWRNGIDKGIGSSGAGTLGELTGLAFGGANVASDWGVVDVAVYLGTSIDADQHSDALQAYAGDQAHERFERLCTLKGVPYATTGTTSQLMSVQRAAKFIESLQDAANADQALLFERRDALGLKFRTNRSRYNQTAIALNYASGHISAPFDPEPDDQAVANDREVKGRVGGYYRAELTTGPLSTQDPPDGVGRYDDTTTVDIFDAAQAQDIAFWRLHVGTWDAERYPSLHVDLSAPGNASLIPAITAADTGDLIAVSNLPAWLPPGDAELAVAGYTEKIAFYDWDFVFACWPGGPWRVAELDDDLLGKLDTAGCELMIAAASGGTTFTVHTTEPPKWTTDSGEMPIPLLISGEVVSATAIANVTPSFVAAGTAAHANNASVSPALPAGLAAGDLLLVFAAIRNSGTGTPNLPSGYVLLADMGNAALFGKYAASGEAAPTITFAGGVANADTSAQTAAWRGVGLTIHNSATQLNGSAQNIAYPALIVSRDACLVLYLGWKQDDWTSVAAIAGATEIGEPDTTTGDDQGLVWDYVLQSTAASIASGSFTVTGGASAISRGAVVALGSDVQTITVTRSVNGVVKAQAARAAINVHNAARLAL